MGTATAMMTEIADDGRTEMAGNVDGAYDGAETTADTGWDEQGRRQL